MNLTPILLIVGGVIALPYIITYFALQPTASDFAAADAADNSSWANANIESIFTS
jgi:hypothetical protein